MRKKELRKIDKGLFIVYMLFVLGMSFMYKQSIVKFAYNFEESIQTGKLVTAIEKQINKVKHGTVISIEQPVIKIEKLKGRVRVSKKGTDYQIDEKEVLEKGSFLLTLEKSFITISFGSKLQNRFTLGPNSTVELDSLFSKKKGSASGSVIKLLRGKVTSELNQLEGGEYRVFTKETSFAVRGTKFLVSKMKNGDNLLVVKKGAVEALNIKTQNKSVAYAGDTLFFLNDGLKFPVSNPELSYKFQQEFDNQAFLDSEMIEEIHNSIALRIDDVKIILMIKDKIVSLDKYYQKKIRSNKQKLAAIPNKMKNFAKEYNKVEKEVQKDIDCLSEGKHCVLKHDSILLKRGMVMTSGRSKINKESIEVLKSYLREFRKEIQRFQKSEQVLSEEIEKQEKWLSLIKKVETNLYPEDESINPELIKEILSLNKEIKDKDLRRYIEMAKWVGP